MKIKALCKNGSIIELDAAVEKSEKCVTATLSMNYDYSDIIAVDFDIMGEAASDGSSGYAVFPPSTETGGYCITYFDKHKEDKFEYVLDKCSMNVFGIKSEKGSYLCVISGMRYNSCIKFIRKNGKYYIYPSFNIDGKQPYEDLKAEFIKLPDGSGYVDMAKCYRNYRINEGVLFSISEREKTYPTLSYTADSVMVRVRCGWKPAPPDILHQTRDNEPPMHIACDFDRVSDIIDELKRQGVKKAEICLVGWNVKGHDGRWPETVPVCEELGGEEKLRVLIKKARDAGYAMVCHTNSTDQYEIAENFDIDNTIMTKDGEYDVNDMPWSGGEMYKLCYKVGYEQALDILPKTAELGFKGCHYIDVIGIVCLRDCHHPNHPLNYSESEEYVKKLCFKTKEIFGGMSSEGAFDFIAPYIDYGLYLDFDAKCGGICDELIPFWSIIYHGYVLCNPTTSTVNPGFKDARSRLKLLEYGGRPTYYFYSSFKSDGTNWMGTVDALADTDEQLRDSVKKIKKSEDIYTMLNSTVRATIEDHRNICENVYETEFSDGTVIKCDYNAFECTVSKNGYKAVIKF